MRILTIVKQVPDSNATIKVTSSGDIEMTGLKLVPDPFDEFGIELALQLREKRSDVTEVVAMTLGPEKAFEALRVALAMGADAGVHICDEALLSRDEIFLARILSEAIRLDEAGFDLIVCGKYNIDLDAGAVGPALAEFLNIPHVGAVQGLEVAENGEQLVARRRIEGAEEVVACPMPVLLTIEKGLVEPRYPSLPNLMKAKKKPVKKLTASDLPGGDASTAATEFISLAPPPPKPECRFVKGEPEEMARELVKLLREEAKVI